MSETTYDPNDLFPFPVLPAPELETPAPEFINNTPTYEIVELTYGQQELIRIGDLRG